MFLANVLPIKLATQHQPQIYVDTQEKIADLILEGTIAKTPVNKISVSKEYQTIPVNAGARLTNTLN